MEEQKKENLPENTEAENSLEDTSEAQKAAQPAGRSFLWMLAGAYLLYTGYSLAAAVIRGEEGATTIFLLIGIVFLAIGAGLVFTGGKNLLKANKMKQELEAGKSAGMAGAEAAAGGELKTEEQPAAQKKMSTADRANLAKRLDEEEASSEVEETSLNEEPSPEEEEENQK